MDFNVKKKLKKRIKKGLEKIGFEKKKSGLFLDL